MIFDINSVTINVSVKKKNIKIYFNRNVVWVALVVAKRLKLSLKNNQQRLQFATNDRLKITISVNITNNKLCRSVALALRIAVRVITEFRSKWWSISSVLGSHDSESSQRWSLLQIQLPAVCRLTISQKQFTIIP